MNEGSGGQVSIYDRMCHSDAELCALLANGAARRELTAVFGLAEYTMLAALARQAQSARRRHAESVYILPGIMGTQLGSARPAGNPPDLLWLDPQDVIAGALTRLQLPEADGLLALGAIPFSYLALQLRLRAAGYAAVTCMTTTGAWISMSSRRPLRHDCALIPPPGSSS